METAMPAAESAEFQAFFREVNSRLTAGDIAAARRLLDQAGTIFEALGTLDEPARVEAARAALDRGTPISRLDSGA